MLKDDWIRENCGEQTKVFICVIFPMKSMHLYPFQKKKIAFEFTTLRNKV